MDSKSRRKQDFLQIGFEIFFPFILAGLGKLIVLRFENIKTVMQLCFPKGMVLAGLLLDHVQHWDVFRACKELFILVPALLGLKGNLEMTLASRLSTAANVGYLDDPNRAWDMAVSNLALVQVQAIVVGGLASCFALLMGYDSNTG